MDLPSFEALFIAELKDLYSAENQLLKAFPKMAKAATSKELKRGFAHHLKQTRGYVSPPATRSPATVTISRLEKVFAAINASPRGKKCKAMGDLIKEGEELTKEESEPEVLDAALIAAAQKVEHYEIAGYGCVRTYAQLLGDQKSADLLQQTLNEESETDKTLTGLAERINVEAEDVALPTKQKRKPTKPLSSRMLESVGL